MVFMDPVVKPRDNIVDFTDPCNK
ncbi:MAG: hypothetical protein LN589_02215 [Rickettsia endosymbiont of Eriopis connexa]|nr:hypothetical protein [Rickettsia endosymbiont of Eriopis connexa]